MKYFTWSGKLKLINIIQDVGCCKLQHISKLLFDVPLETLKYNTDNNETLLIINEYF